MSCLVGQWTRKAPHGVGVAAGADRIAVATRLWAASVATALLCGCQGTGGLETRNRGVALSADPHAVIVTSDRRVAGACHALGRDSVQVIGPNLAQSAVASLRVKAADRGGNLVVSDGPISMLAGGPRAAAAGSYVTMSGDIYLC